MSALIPVDHGRSFFRDRTVVGNTQLIAELDTADSSESV